MTELSDLAAIQPVAARGSTDVRRILNRLRDEAVELRNGMDPRNRTRRAWIEQVREDSVLLRHRHIDPNRQPWLVFSFELEGASYSMVVEPNQEGATAERLAIALPEAIHTVERRRRIRRPLANPEPVRLRLASTEGGERQAYVYDRSHSGVGLRLMESQVQSFEPGTPVAILAGKQHEKEDEKRKRTKVTEGTEAFVRPRALRDTPAVVRHVRPDGDPRWRRVGLALSPVDSGVEVVFERRDRVLAGGGFRRGWRRVAFAGDALRLASDRAQRRLRARIEAEDAIHLVEFRNQRGEILRGIVDRTHDTPGGYAVVIPPAWGRTKETLMPLARTLVETFRSAGERLTVLRYDGTQRRGESHVDSECRAPGDESLHFTYSQAAEDLRAAARFLRKSPTCAAKQIALVTFSLASIEGRLALARDDEGLFQAWLAVVGMTDVQSALKSVSGGIDYVLGKEQGLAFGIHELGGVRVDIDRAAVDVLRSDIATLDEARRDMEDLRLPITWIHGRHDGWTDLARARELLTAGEGRRVAPRKLIEVPTGHQLRNSREALETFQLVADEVSRMLLGRSIRTRAPSLARLDRRNAAERERLSKSDVDLRRFWHDYLLGRDGSVGMQLLGATSFYGRFMEEQIAALGLFEGARVLDLGCGTGEFLERLACRRRELPRVRVFAADLVADALRRSCRRVALAGGLTNGAVPRFCCADFNRALPFRPGAFDCLLSSLVVSYLEDARAFLHEIRRVLRPGGTLVLSSPKRDADLSSLYQQTMLDITPDVLETMAGPGSKVSFDQVQRNYLNDASRLVDLEETGRFRFRESEELAALVAEAGFEQIRTFPALGEPPQAVVVSAIRNQDTG